MDILIQNFKRKIVLFLFLTSIFQLKAQPGIIGTGFSTGWEKPKDTLQLSPSLGQSYMRILKSKGSGNRYFRLLKGIAELSPSITCTNGDDKNINTTDVALLSIGSTNCMNGQWYVNTPNTSDNYVFKTNSSTFDEFFVARIQGTIRTVESISHLPAEVLVGQNVNVTATLSGTFANGQKAYLRYSRDNFVTSSILTMANSGTTCTATIPASANSLGTVQYYIFTSGNGIPLSDASKADFFSINLDNNDGNYYSYSIGGGTTYNWNGTTNNDFQVNTNWTPIRNTLAASDILVFNNSLNNTVTNIPQQSIGSLQILNNTIVNLQSAYSATLNINNGINGYDLIVGSNSQLNINGTNILKLSLNSNASASISGNMTFSNAAHSINAVSAGAIIFNSGSSLTQGTGFGGDIFTAKGTKDIVIFSQGSEFIHKAGGHPFGFSQPNSKVIFQTGSWYRFQASNNATDPSLSGRSFGNFEFNPPSLSLTRTSTGTGTLTLDTLNISTGILNINVTGGVIIKGNINIASDAMLTFTPPSESTFSLTNATTQSISNSGNFTIGSNATVNLNTNAIVNGIIAVNGTLNMTNAIISGTGYVKLSSESNLSTNHAGGVYGSITTKATDFSNFANYVYTGLNNQTENIKLTTATSITINKSAGNVTFQNDMTISNTLTFATGNQGVINMGNNTLKISNSAATAINRLGNGHVIGKLQRTITNENSNYDFPIGTNAGYTPVSIALTGLTGFGNITAQSNDGKHLQVGTNELNQTAYLNRWWQLSKSGINFTNANISFDYLSTDLIGGANSNSLKVAQYSNSVWSYPSVSTSSNSISALNITTLEDFTAAIPPPSNDNASSPTPLTQTVSSSCNSTISGTLYGANVSNVNACNGSNYSALVDVWYRFMAKTPNSTITINGNTDLIIQLLESNTTTSVTCSNTSTSNIETLNAMDLMAGKTYYIRVLAASGTPDALTGAFTICVNGETAPSVSSGSVGNCQTVRSILIPGTTTNEWIPITDDANNIVAAIKDENNNLGTVTCKIFVREPSTLRTNSTLKIMDRDFEITPSNNISATVRLYFTPEDLSAMGGSLTAGKIMRIAGGACSTSSDFTGGSEITPTAIGPNYIEFVTPSFSRFYMASPSSPLPVELVSFDVYTEGGANILKWVVASQINTSHFIVERSSDDLKIWLEISKPIPAAGTTTEIKKYSETDIFPIKQAYYRLKIVDFDGKIQYSKVINIQKTGNIKGFFMVYPNPIDEMLNIEFESPSNQKTSFEILDIYGRVIQTHYFNAENGINNYSLNLNLLPKGVYFLKTNLEGKSVVEKIFKK